jgi:hypothetical protein
MRKGFIAGLVMVLAGVVTPRVISQDQAWSMTATVIEACTCPLFCQCYFDSKPA